MEIARGDLVTIAMQGDCGKPRPALVVQADAFAGLESITLLRITSGLHDWPSFRVPIEPSPSNGLIRRSHIMIDKAASVPRVKIERCIGQVDRATMVAVDSALAKFFGLE